MIKQGLKTIRHTQFLEITPQVQQIVNQENWQSGVLTLYVPHTTAGLTINENADPDVIRDMTNALERLVPWQHEDYHHFEGNTAAHVKTSLLGSSQQIIVANGELQLGRWQGIYFAEFDGPRTREVWVAFSGK
ncbi:MAG: secondary thiamine-phosphate synthase enzyme YjbQ [Candidatus Marinimicrobia bacterium]|nr:secondary thiamine-phosphate synthase enzyme YjbQ [Candidatus Neomarinimicrobiota bacterium]MCF7902362.1 secondary thiamine-phosphate synthase enzyme YjbQ [Candidatus Neomarinimicrobiota bacterium]